MCPCGSFPGQRDALSSRCIEICVYPLLPSLCFSLRAPLCAVRLSFSGIVLKMLSLLFVFLSVAAGSTASPCKVSPGSPAASSTNSSAVVNPTGSVPGTHELVAPSGLASSRLTTNLGGQGSVPKLFTGSSSQNCPAGFLNTVFNTNAPDQVGWPSTVWDSLTSHGVNEWSMLHFICSPVPFR